MEIVVGADLATTARPLHCAAEELNAGSLGATPFVPKLHFPSAITVLTWSTPASHSDASDAEL